MNERLAHQTVFRLTNYTAPVDYFSLFAAAIASSSRLAARLYMSFKTPATNARRTAGTIRRCSSRCTLLCAVNVSLLSSSCRFSLLYFNN